MELLGRRIWVEQAGSGDAILLIAGGGGGSHDYFHPFFDALAATHRVIYYDAFGRGRSERADDPSAYSFEHDVEEIEALRAALGIERLIVYGHSFSVFTAQAYATRHPERVRALVLANGMVSGAAYQQSTDALNANVALHLPELWENVRTLRARGVVASAQEMQQAYLDQFLTMMGLFYFHDPLRVQDIVFTEDTFNPAVYYQLVGPDADFVIGGDIAPLDFGDAMSTTTMPLLILAGRFDGVVFPTLVREFLRYRRDAEWVVFERSGHFPFMEETARNLEVIRSFLARPAP